MEHLANPNQAFATAGAATIFKGDYIVIDGVALGLDEILNEQLFAPQSIASLHQTFVNNKPFPHVIIEDLFSPRLLELMNAEFDRINWSDWRHFDNAKERKRGSMPNTRFSPATELYFNKIHSGRFVDFIAEVSGIKGLITDAALHFGGLHEIPTGGKFAMHTDFNQHHITGLDNRLVFITYLNKEWQSSYGGALELWDVDTGTCKVEIDPVFGRSILFQQSSRSLHGHPKPVNAPGGRSRRSAAAYFYTNGRDDGESTKFHTTLFPMPIAFTRTDRIVNAIKYIIPPILLEAFRNIRSKVGEGHLKASSREKDKASR